jgi:hypothetical protein
MNASLHSNDYARTSYSHSNVYGKVFSDSFAKARRLPAYDCATLVRELDSAFQRSTGVEHWIEDKKPAK